MPSEDAHGLIAYLKSLIHEENPPSQIPCGFESSPDFWDLQTDFLKLREISLALKKISPAGEICDLNELKQLKKELIENAERHRLLIENASDIICTVSLEGNFTYISPSAERMTGYTIDEIMNHYQEINYFLPETMMVMRRTLEIIKRMVKNNERFDSVRYEQKQLTKDGRIFWTDTVLTGVYDEDGQLKELLGVSRDITEQVRLRNEIISLSQTDKLTQLYNRSKLDDLLECEFRRSNRIGLPFAVILLDVDHFKKVNDQFGHQAGDAILIQMADIFRSCIRSTDSVGRWGGEEFLFVLPDTDEAGALRLAEKIRMRISETTFVNPEQVTASMGVSVYRGTGTLTAVIARADDAMYAAKKAGRNQVQLL